MTLLTLVADLTRLHFYSSNKVASGHSSNHLMMDSKRLNSLKLARMLLLDRQQSSLMDLNWRTMLWHKKRTLSIQTLLIALRYMLVMDPLHRFFQLQTLMDISTTGMYPRYDQS